MRSKVLIAVVDSQCDRWGNNSWVANNNTGQSTVYSWSDSPSSGSVQSKIPNKWGKEINP
jgi:hypothetical protein